MLCIAWYCAYAVRIYAPVFIRYNALYCAVLCTIKCIVVHVLCVSCAYIVCVRMRCAVLMCNAVHIHVCVLC